MAIEIVEIELTCMNETFKAMRMHPGEPEKAVWLPKSQIEVDPPGNIGVKTVTMPRWLAEEKGLI